jgi:hypothetical protein
MALAEAAAEGRWQVFGAQASSGGPNRWTTHPITGAPTKSAHWRSIEYMNGIDGADVKYLWELNRHQPLVRIAQGYFLTRRPELAEQVVSLLDEWVQENPPGRGINWTSSLEIGFRAIAWCWIWSLTADSPAWTDERLSRFLVALWHHARHIERYDSTHHSPNTHLTGELLALLYVGQTFPELSRAARWRRRGHAVLRSELDRQVLSDGMHFERSIGYHRYTAEFYLHYTLLARAAGEPVSPQVADRVRQMVAVSWLTRLPDGSWPVIGDEDSGSTLLVGTGDAQAHTTILAVGAALFGESAWLNGVDASGRSGAWWLLDGELWKSLGAAEPGPGPASGVLREAGYYVGRESESAQSWYCLVDAGPHGGDRTGHAHTDLGHVEIAHGPVRIVADAGCASYTTSPAARNWCRSEAAHACVVIDDAPLAVPRGAFSWQRVPGDPTVQTGTDDAVWWCELSYRRPGASAPVTHHRQVALVRGVGVLVADWIEADSPVSFAVHWPLAVDVAVLEGRRAQADGFMAQWTVTRGEEMGAALDRVRTSPGYGRERNTVLIRVPVRCDGMASVVTAFTEGGVTLTATGGARGAIVGELRGARCWKIELLPGRAPDVTLLADSRG